MNGVAMFGLGNSVPGGVLSSPVGDFCAGCLFLAGGCFLAIAAYLILKTPRLHPFRAYLFRKR